MNDIAWIKNEFSSIDLNDSRLDKRLLKVSSNLINNPSESIQTAIGSWSDTKAAYRLFDNEKLNEQAILNVHQEKTLERLTKSNDIVHLAIQDTTKLNYTHHPKKQGLGKLHKSSNYTNPLMGCLLHSTLLVNNNGLPLGLLDQKIYKHTETIKKSKQTPITKKESYRWIESLQNTNKLTKDKNVITICDRESDIFEFFVEAQRLNAKILLRASYNRILFNSKHHEHENLWPYMQKQDVIISNVLNLPARHNKPARKAILDIRFAPVVIKPPQRAPKAKIEKLPDVNLYAVYIIEPNPPENTEQLEWMLLTNMEITNDKDALQIANWYRVRWQIENFHRVLKSGCKVEDCRLETYERLKKIITLKSIIAFRLLWLTHINRNDPEESCDKVLTKPEWQALYCKINKTNKLPNKPPTVKNAISMIAKLGGFLGRKNDGHPGMTYIWRGWSKLREITELWEILNHE